MSLIVKHTSPQDLALLAGGELSPLRWLLVQSHVGGCASCREQVQQFTDLRKELADADADLPEVSWTSLAAEMRANIRLGLEAGACIEPTFLKQRFNPRLAVAFASLCLLAASAFYFRGQPAPMTKQDNAISVLAATAGGLELRTGSNSLTLLNHQGAVADQTVGADGEIRARYVDKETGSVTINNVYLEN